jgi:three-Cys-motif partner protein
MADESPTVWQADPHTFAKHAILEGYLKAWLPILSRQSYRFQGTSQEVLFIDGFAGPGEYKGGEPGSPIIAVEAALNHSVSFPVPIRLLFIEEREDRCTHLAQLLKKYNEGICSAKNVRVSRPRHGECDAVLGERLNEHERRGVKFGPALAFLDQFGYSAVSMELVKRILAFPQCEVFLYLDYKDMNRWITDPKKASSFTRTYGGEEWREAIDMPERDRRAHLFNAYKNALKERANARYVYAFAMFDKVDRLLYWLVFCTNSLRGLEEMKRAMWKVDESGSFKFSDNDNPDQLELLNAAHDQNWLAEELCAQLAGREMSVADVKEHVLTRTTCYLFKAALQSLETGKKQRLELVRAPARRRRGTFRDEDLDEIVVRFPPRSLF